MTEEERGNEQKFQENVSVQRSHRKREACSREAKAIETLSEYIERIESQWKELKIDLSQLRDAIVKNRKEGIKEVEERKEKEIAIDH